MLLQADVCHMAVLLEHLAAMEPGQTFHLKIVDEDILIGEITYRPQQPRRYRLGLRFGAEFGFPFHPGGIFSVKLRAVALIVFLHELDRKLRLVVSAGTKQKVLCLDVSWIAPDDGGAILFD